jgi:hypothetical protein
MFDRAEPIRVNLLSVIHPCSTCTPKRSSAFRLSPPLRSFQKGQKALANTNSRYLPPPPPTTTPHERPLMRALSKCSHRAHQTLAGRAPASEPEGLFSMPNILTSWTLLGDPPFGQTAGLDPPPLPSDSELELPPLSPLHKLVPDNL